MKYNQIPVFAKEKKENMFKNAVLHCKKILTRTIESNSHVYKQEIALQIVRDFFNIFEDIMPVIFNSGSHHKIDPFEMISPILEFSDYDVGLTIDYENQTLYLTSVEEPQAILTMKENQVTIEITHDWYQSCKSIILNPSLQMITFNKSICDNTKGIIQEYDTLLHHEEYTWHS